MRTTTFIRSVSAFFLAVLFLIDLGFAQSANANKVKTETIWQYDVIAGEVQTKGLKISFREANQNNQTTELTSYGPDGSVLQKTSYVYNDSGNPSQTTTTSSVANVSQKMIYNYDGDLLVESISYKPDGSMNMRMEYKYNQNKQLTEMTTYSPGGQVNIKVVNHYDADGNIVEAIGYDALGNEITKTTYGYSATGLDMVKTGINAAPVQRTKKSFNRNGQLTEEIQYDSKGNEISKTQQTYDENGNLIEIINSVPYSDMRTRTVIKYNENGNLAEQISYNKLDEPVKVIRCEYEYY